MARIEIVETETGEVVHSIDCSGKTERQIERAERGVNINLNHQDFHTRIVEEATHDTRIPTKEHRLAKFSD